MNNYLEGRIFYGVLDAMLVECTLTFYDKSNKRLYFKSTKSEQSFTCSSFEKGHSVFENKEDAKGFCKYEEGQKFYHIDKKGNVRMCELIHYNSKEHSMTLRDYQSKVRFKGNEKYIGKTLFDTADIAIEATKSSKNKIQGDNNKTYTLLSNGEKKSSFKEEDERIKRKRAPYKSKSHTALGKEFEIRILPLQDRIWDCGVCYQLGRHIFIPIGYNRVDHGRIILDKDRKINYISLITLNRGSFEKEDENKKFFYNVDVAESKSMKFPNPNKNSSVSPSAVFGFTRSSKFGNGSKKMSRPKELPQALKNKHLQDYNEDT